MIIITHSHIDEGGVVACAVLEVSNHLPHDGENVDGGVDIISYENLNFLA